MPELTLLKDSITLAVEAAGVAVILVGGLAATLSFTRALWMESFDDAYRAYRRNLGRAILLGLELLVAADIIGTAAIRPTLHDIAVLAGVVLIRTFLSFSLDIEISGHLPWRREPHDP